MIIIIMDKEEEIVCKINIFEHSHPKITHLIKQKISMNILAAPVKLIKIKYNLICDFCLFDL